MIPIMSSILIMELYNILLLYEVAKRKYPGITKLHNSILKLHNWVFESL